MNIFALVMTKEVFGQLRRRFQIPDDIPIREANEGERCYSGNTKDIGFYEAAFIARLKLPLSEINHWLANHLGIFVYQLYPNV